MHSVSFIVPGPIRGKQRPRVTKFGTFTPQQTVNAEAWVRQCAVLAGVRVMEGPIYLELAIWHAIPASWSRKKRDQALSMNLMPTCKPDIDNVVKLIGDSLNGIAWADDKQIVTLQAGRRYADHDCIAVTITELAPTLQVAA